MQSEIFSQCRVQQFLTDVPHDIRLIISVADWLFACAALVLISLISTLIASGSGVLGLCTHKQLFYYAAAIITIFAGECIQNSWCCRAS